MKLKLIILLQLHTFLFSQISSSSYSLIGSINSTVGVSASTSSILGGSFGEYHADSGILQSSNYMLLPFSSIIYSLEISDIQSNDLLPSEFNLSQNYPNPFNPSTTIEFSLEKSGDVKIQIFNIKGQLVETLVDNYKTPGSYYVNWNPSSLSSGQYFYQIVVDGQPVSTKKAIFLK